MSRMIYAKDITALSVVELMNGRKTKIAVKDKNVNFKIETKSVITQYLNPNNERTKMTPKIAEAVCNNFEYYIRETADNESFGLMCGKALLFIYSVSGIDMTYIIQKNYDDSGKEYITDFLIKIVNMIFKSFIRKEGIEFSELQEIVYKNLFGVFLSDNGDVIDISQSTYIKYIPQLDDNYPRDDEEIYTRLDYLLELIMADDMEEFSNIHGKEKIRIYKEKISGERWKELYFLNKFGIISFLKINSKIIEENNYLFERMRLKLYKNAIDSLMEKYDTVENRTLSESNIFKSFMGELENYTNFIRLQARTDKELASFGCFKPYNKIIDEPRKLVTEMMDFLFYGVYAKVGRDNGNGNLTEVWRDYISKYISGEQQKFTKTVKDAVYNRIKYNLENNEYFESLLWQFMYYVFGIDFYMVRSQKEWLDIVEQMLKDVMENKSVSEIREHMQMIFDRWQFRRLSGNKVIRFTPYDVKYFRFLDVLGLNWYQDTHNKILSGDNGFDCFEIRNEMTIKYIELRIDILMNKLCKTIELAEKLLKIKSPDEMTTEGRLRLGDEKNNWKYNLLYNMCDDTSQKIAISLEELKELLSWISTLIIGNRINGKNCDKRKDEFKGYAKRIANMQNVRYESIYKCNKNILKKKSVKRFNELNKELWKSEIIQNMYKWIKKILGYIIYSDWIDENIKLV